MTMLKLHFIAWASGNEEQKAVVEDIIRGLERETYRAEVLGFDGNVKLDVREPQTAWERDVMRELLDELRARSRAPARGADSPETPDAAAPSPAPNESPPPAATPVAGHGVANEDASPARTGLLEEPVPILDPDTFRPPEDDQRLFRERIVATGPNGAEQYHFFQPVIYHESCNTCHGSLRGTMPASAEDAQLSDRYEPFRVVRIVLDHGVSRGEVNWIRAVLIAAGIITFFVAMVALYVIVRYVVVSPLKHLRDVSDAISRGNLDLRAEIHTNDEFEDLAASFNRMLRQFTESQADLRAVNKDLDAKVDELAQLNMRLYETNRVKSEFLANMSHELRTPLNSIIGFSEVLQGIDSLTDKQRRYAQNIRKAGRSLLDMINDILDVAKIEAGKMEVRPTEFPVDGVIQTQCEMVRALTEGKNIDLSVQIEENLPHLFQDQGKVQQILTNLLSNAIKFTPEGGRITVRGEREASGRFLLTVADTGVGIAEEDREIVFEKFRQSRMVAGEDSLTREYSGTGLGLSIVRELCKLLRGEIDFESELGKGSTFRVRLPWSLDECPLLPSPTASESSARRHATGVGF
ncbi:MAG: HAMP domain-containing protein [Planctomycetes bacterium]|nr:HAMP domain-containing protein [Planctomycetota bacterium]